MQQLYAQLLIPMVYFLASCGKAPTEPASTQKQILVRIRLNEELKASLFWRGVNASHLVVTTLDGSRQKHSLAKGTAISIPVYADGTIEYFGFSHDGEILVRGKTGFQMNQKVTYLDLFANEQD